MKKFIGYVLLMTMVIVVLPLIIVRGCSTVAEELIPLDDNQPPPEEIEEKDEVLYDEVLYLDVYIANKDKIKKMPLEEYLIGVVAAEMAVDFEIEALKAQAVAARTYAYGRMKKIYANTNADAHNGADVCTDSGHCQAWIDKADALKKWGKKMEKRIGIKSKEQLLKLKILSFHTKRKLLILYIMQIVVVQLKTPKMCGKVWRCLI